MSADQVPPVIARTKAEVSSTLAQDWLRFSPPGSREERAKLLGVTSLNPGKIISRAIAGEHLPEAHTILNTLAVDEVGLFNTLNLYGGVFVKCRAGSCDDYEIIRKMLHAASEYMDRMKDGRRCHRDTSALAKLLTPLVPAMLAIIKEAE